MSSYDQENIIQPAELWDALPPVKYAIDGFIPYGTLAALCGEGASGKTYALLDLAVCVATGTPWLGRSVLQSPVLIIDEESGKRRLLSRLQATMRGHNIPTTQYPLIYAQCKTGFDANDTTKQQILSERIEATKAKLIIIDSLAVVTPGLDENSKQMRPPLDALQKIAQTYNATIFIIHHNNKNGSFRGFSGIRDCVDYMFTMQKQSDSITIKADKSRDYSEDTIDINARTIFTPNEFHLIASSEGARETAFTQIKTIVTDNPNMCKSDLAAALGGRKQKAMKYIDAALSAGIIENISNNSYTKYIISDRAEIENDLINLMEKIQ